MCIPQTVAQFMHPQNQTICLIQFSMNDIGIGITDAGIKQFPITVYAIFNGSHLSHIQIFPAIVQPMVKYTRNVRI